MLGHGWTDYRRKGRELFIAEKVRDTDSKTGKVLIGFCTPRTGVVFKKKLDRKRIRWPGGRRAGARTCLPSVCQSPPRTLPRTVTCRCPKTISAFRPPSLVFGAPLCSCQVFDIMVISCWPSEQVSKDGRATCIWDI